MYLFKINIRRRERKKERKRFKKKIEFSFEQHERTARPLYNFLFLMENAMIWNLNNM